jgi:hypothetical protein
MFPCTTAWFSSGVPCSRLLETNLGTSERVMITEKRPLGVEHHLALRIGTKIIGLLAVLLKRDGSERPRPHKLLGRLRDRLLSGQKNYENQC